MTGHVLRRRQRSGAMTIMPTTPDIQFVPHKQGRVAYREAGTGPTLLLFHGMNGTSRSWSFAFEALSPFFRIIAWDAPSCGESDCFGDLVEDYVAAARSLIETLDLQNVVVIGHSMGGVVAAQLVADPSMSITGLILSSTHLGFGRPAGEPLMSRYATRIQRLETKGVGAEYGLERAKRNTPNGTPEDVILFLADIAKDIRVEQIRDGGRMSQEADNAAFGELITVPILILSGGKDTVISPEMHDALIKAFPSAEQVVFPNAGHASYAECPEQYHAEIRKFADRTTG